LTSRLFILPLEPLEERYTGQWYKWLPASLGAGFDSVQVIDGKPLTDTVQVGAFLDLNSTAHYKASQLQEVARLFHSKQVKSGDAFWVSDIEFWGIESIRYLARLQGIKVKLFGFLHAASYTTEDFMAPMADIGRYLEPAWIAAFDRVYVGSEYHRQKLRLTRLLPLGHEAVALLDRVVVTGNPWRSDECRAAADQSGDVVRDIDLCFPHRPDREKRLGIFLAAARELQARLKREISIALTTGRAAYRSTNDQEAVDEAGRLSRVGGVRIFTNLNRAGFYNILGRSKVVVSTAIEENFGYAMIEGMTMGALPLMPDRYSYPELVQKDRRFTYETAVPGPDSLVGGMENLLSLSPVAFGEWSRTAQRYAAEFDSSELRIAADMGAEMLRP